MVDVVRAIDRLHGTILPTSNRKIAECKVREGVDAGRQPCMVVRKRRY